MGREGEKERESDVGLSVRHFGNLCSCGPVWRWWLTWPELRAAASSWFPRIITLIGSICAAVHWFVSTFLLLVIWISPCFLPLLRSDRRLQVFSYSALRQSGLAICNFRVPHFVWRSGLIHCWDSSFFQHYRVTLRKRTDSNPTWCCGALRTDGGVDALIWKLLVGKLWPFFIYFWTIPSL